jgi:hypothetical protein
MKLVLLFVVTVIFSNLVYGQNIVLLKSGDKMNGKVDGFKNDTLIFIYKGNKIQFKSSEISAVYFDETQLPINNLNYLVKPTGQNQNGKISGVITYFFNDNLGYKPDVGAEVLVISSAKISNFNYSIIDSFLNPEMYSITNKTVLSELDKGAWDEIAKIKYENIAYCQKLIVDGNGNFSSDFPEGTYYVLVTSANRHGYGMSDALGKYGCKKLIVKPGETTYFNKKFDVD